jgi:hypothetical protein
MAIFQFFPKEKFFTSIDSCEFRPGQFCRIVTPHISPIPQILDVERSGPEEHDEVRFILRNANKPRDFRADDRTLPLKNLNLRAHEELLVQRAKKRPGIILSAEADVFPEIERLLRGKAKKHCQEDYLFVIPAYSIETPTSLSGYPLQMVGRIRCLIYRQFFYFPDCLPHFREGIARFDRIQTVIGRDISAIEPLPISLSQEVFSIFQAMFIYCISGIEDEDLKAIRELTREAMSVSTVAPHREK